jgi:3-oxoacyl-[acyl-carrier protein] reductase
MIYVFRVTLGLQLNWSESETMNELDFHGRQVLVVGGSSGIGNGIAQAFRERGARVHVWGTRAGAADYNDEPGSNLAGLGYTQVDVGDPEQIFAVDAPFVDGVDVLVLSQGMVAYRRQEFQREAWDRVMSINLDSLIYCCERFKPELSARKGSVVIVSSISGLAGAIGNPAYGASKAGALNLTKSLGQAYASAGIRVNGLAPGLVDTKLTKVTVDHPERAEAALRTIPAARFGTPADMAGAALFLASPLAAYVYGHTLVVDGGLSL